MKIPGQRIRTAEKSVVIDGAYGEGGGQIIRTACALSALSGISCRIHNIRGGRDRSGLRAQHCTAIKGLSQMCNAETSPLRVGANEIAFTPSYLRECTLDLDTGTAGSISLVLQSLLLAGLGLPGPVRITLRGGTDVTGAPTCDYIKNIKLEILKRMGYLIEFQMLERGYYPKGGGIVEVRLQPPGGELLTPLQIAKATEAVGAYGVSHADSSLEPRHVAQRQGKAATKMLTDYLHVPARISVTYGASESTGSGVTVWVKTKESIFGASSLGRSGKSSEEVAEEATEKLLRTYHTLATLDPWLGDPDSSLPRIEQWAIGVQCVTLDPSHENQYVDNTTVP